jgi:acetoacetate decarboxylase
MNQTSFSRLFHTWTVPRGSPNWFATQLLDIVLKGAWTGPGALELHSHALAPVAELPVREVVSATHILADLTLGLGEVVFDYLA